MKDEANLTDADLSNIPNGVTADITHSVKRWNEWFSIIGRTDRENYVEGNRQFILENIPASANCVTQELFANAFALPVGFDVRPTEDNIEVWQVVGHKTSVELANATDGEFLFIDHWNRKPVLVDAVQVMDCIEQLVATHIVVGLQCDNGIKELSADFMGESVFDLSYKSFKAIRKRKLDVSLAIGAGNMRRDDRPIGVIESRSKVMQNIPNDDVAFIEDGFVKFGIDGSFRGIYIRCNHKLRHGFLSKQRHKAVNVFRGPINL